MSKKHLIAIELDELSAETVLSKAKALTEANDHCDLIHVIDPTAITYAIDPTFTGRFAREFEDNAVKKAHARILELSTPHKLPHCTCHIRVGRIAHEIRDLLESDTYDTLMIGSHGRHGWQRLLGTHAARLVSNSTVDTWVFRVPEA